jgi:hypothetical protein
LRGKLYGNFYPNFIQLNYSKEVDMVTEPNTQLIVWQDFKVRSEVDIVLEIARQKGWNDCEIFGSGNMITQPQESIGWKLIPADLYEYSIPTEGVDRVLQTINAGVRIQGIIIADDERRAVPPPIPARPKISLAAVKKVVSTIGKALLMIMVVAGVFTFVLFGLILVAHMITLSPWVLGIGLIVLLCSGASSTSYDPKLIILVDDGNGGTVWISLLAWYD